VEKHLELAIQPQPTPSTCGPTSLHAVYNYYGDDIALDRVVSEVEMLEDGGTLSVMLATHALRRGYSAKIYTFNLTLFDPTWFDRERPVDLPARLREQARHKHGRKLQTATRGYIEFLKLGGEVCYEDLSSALIRRYLNKGIPLLTGLSSTYLYRESREMSNQEPSDVAGEPQGHFVVLHGYNRELRQVAVADPWYPNPHSDAHHYMIGMERVVCSILLGIVTYDANLLAIEQLKKGKQ